MRKKAVCARCKKSKRSTKIRLYWLLPLPMCRRCHRRL